MVHTSSYFGIRRGSVGCIAKQVAYKGTSAHAGGSPWNGCNALYAATLGLQAINSIRETFKEQDIIRVHPIITKGGGAVNAIPDLVTIESYVRGSSFEGIIGANKRVNRALIGAALSLGAQIEITDISGYTPLLNDQNLAAVSAEAAKVVFPDRTFNIDPNMGSGSTDMGDLSAIMPAIHPYCPGAAGIGHGDNYTIDPELACVGSAKWQMVMLSMLLSDDAKAAKRIIKEFTPQFSSKEVFLNYVDSLNASGERIAYHEDGTASVSLI